MKLTDTSEDEQVSVRDTTTAVYVAPTTYQADNFQ